MKKIVIDARESGTTTGRYVDKLIEYLALARPPYEVTLLAKPARLEFLKKLAPGFEVVLCPYKEFTFAEQLGYWRQLKGLGADLVHFPMVQQPVLYRGRVVTTMNDLTTARFRNPTKFGPVFLFKQQVYKWLNRRVARKSAAILTYSQFVKDDVAKFAGIRPDKITVTPLAADALDSPAQPMERLTGKQFLLYVGRPATHKNLERLLAAFSGLQSHSNLYLVLAGKKDAGYKRLENFVHQRGLERVVFTDFVSDRQLRWLYENCAAYVFPSLSEGFGLPGLEAMLHNAPVVSSNATCLPEVYGDGAHYFDPLNADAIASAIKDVLNDGDLRQKLVKAGKSQAAKYSWQKTAEQTLVVYKQLLGG